ncbi:hypothetical protein BH10PAT1_BH10PAT1_3600 [soil metagenome]
MPQLKKLVIYLIYRKEKVLLEKRYKLGEKKFNNYIIPAGKVEKGEKPEQALIREVKEEVNVKVEKYQLIDSYIGLTLSNERKKFFVYLVKEFDGSIKNNEPEKAEFKWVNTNSVEKYLTFETSIKIVNSAKPFLPEFT